MEGNVYEDMKEEKKKKKKEKIRLDSVLQRNYILFTAGYHVIMCVGTGECIAAGSSSTPTPRCSTSRWLATYRPICVFAIINFFLSCVSRSSKSRPCI